MISSALAQNLLDVNWDHFVPEVKMFQLEKQSTTCKQGEQLCGNHDDQEGYAKRRLLMPI